MKINRRITPLSLLMLGALALAAVVWATGAFGTSDSLGPDDADAADLRPFDSCQDLFEYARDHRSDMESVPYPTIMEDMAMPAAAGLARQSAAASPDSVGTSETGTNVQEAGIDEPDIAKLSGGTLFAVERGELRAFDVSGEIPVPLGALDLRSGRSAAQLLVAGDRVIVMSDEYGEPDWEPKTVLTEVDVSDPAGMWAVSELEIEGAQVSARLQDETARLVINSTPDYGPAAEASEWLPEGTSTDLVSGDSTTVPLFECESVSYPERFSGLGMLSVITLDVSGGMTPTDVDAVVADGSTVYASASSTYVATTAIPTVGALDRVMSAVGSGSVTPVVADETAIHRFDTSEPATTSYESSGRVDGRILNEWSFSEFGGYLRVATTEGDPWATGEGESESSITVLGESDGELKEVGKVSGLGRGEEIHGVRFVEDMGYVVTFEQTDPLYAVDLSSPESPVMAGELKIPGYSAYLHPVGEGRLLGIGQAGTATGTLTGAQASLFDVADAESPQRLATLDLSVGGYGSAAAEWDHHAFLFSPELSMAVVPVDSYDGFRGAVAMRVEPDGTLTEIDRIEGHVDRSFLVGQGRQRDRLVTLSRGEVSSHDLAGLDG